jgi:hypothetical protein
MLKIFDRSSYLNGDGSLSPSNRVSIEIRNTELEPFNINDRYRFALESSWYRMFGESKHRHPYGVGCFCGGKQGASFLWLAKELPANSGF